MVATAGSVIRGFRASVAAVPHPERSPAQVVSWPAAALSAALAHSFHFCPAAAFLHALRSSLVPRTLTGNAMRSLSSLAAKSLPLGAGIEFSVVDAEVLTSRICQVDVINRSPAVTDAVSSPFSGDDLFTGTQDFARRVEAAKCSQGLSSLVAFPRAETAGFNHIGITV